MSEFAGLAVATLAHAEWSRRWRSLLLMGVIGGLFGGLLVGGAGLARRTVSAPSRLHEAVQPGDAHVQVFGDRHLAESIAGLDPVSRAEVAGLAVAQVAGPVVQYVGVTAPIADVVGLFEPVVLAGRLPRPDEAREVALDESIAAALGLDAGDGLRLSLLTAEEVGQFDTGFGAPDGPTVDLVVTAVVRVPPGALAGRPVLATPAFAADHAAVFAGYDLTVDLRDRQGAASAFAAGVDDLVADTGQGGSPDQDFAPVTIDDPRAATAIVEDSSRVLIGGLLVAILVGAIAVLVALGQAWSRHHAASAVDQRIESALGLATSERVVARAIPAGASAVVAGLLAAMIGTCAAALEPAGSARRFEPDPGWRVDPVVVVVGGLAVTAAVVAVAAFTAWRSGRDRLPSAPSARSRWWALVPHARGWPLAGVAFALSSGGARRQVPVRMSLAGCVVGIAGLVGAVTFDASLDRLVDTPSRQGWTGDLAIADIDGEVLAVLLADDRVAAVADVSSSTVRVGGDDVPAYAYREVRGSLSWVLLEGRLPVTGDEVVLGTRLADRLGAGTGDALLVGDGTTMTVVGVGLGAPLTGEDLGLAVLVHPPALAALSTFGAFREAVVRVAPGTDAAIVVDDLATRYEVLARELPSEVRNVADLGALPLLLGGFLGVLAVVALGHALVVTARRRVRDLAVLRALGSTPWQAGLAIVAMAVVTIVLGLVIGVPLGWAAARLAWGELAGSIGVRGDVVVPALPVVLVFAGSFVVGAGLALVPALRAMGTDPGQQLRAE